MVMVVVNRLVVVIVVISVIVGIFVNRPDERKHDEYEGKRAGPEAIEKIPVHFPSNFCHQDFFGGT